MNIALADDHALMRMALKSLLERAGFSVTKEAGCFTTLTETLLKHEIHVVICDCKMAGMGAVNFMSWIKTHLSHIRVIFLSALESCEMFSQLISLGANGITSKQSNIEDVLSAIKNTKNQPFISDNLQHKLNQSHQTLTNKEFQIYELIVQGLNNNEIATLLHRSPSTVNTHRVSLMQKLNVHSVVELVHTAHNEGLFLE